MAVQLSTSVRNARLDQIETTISTSAKLRMFTGSPPANCGTADSGTKLVEMALPSDYLANAASGAKSKSGTWSDSGITAGTAGYFRIYDSGFAACHIQGTVTASGGRGDMTLDNTCTAAPQGVTVNTFTLSDRTALWRKKS